MIASFENIGFVIGILGAVWLKASMHLLRHEKDRPESRTLVGAESSPAVAAFIKGLSLILLGFGVETVARLLVG